jgi:hypothetical protein
MGYTNMHNSRDVDVNDVGGQVFLWLIISKLYEPKEDLIP